MKKKIAIIAGGDSSEIVISLKSAEGLYSFIDKDKYDLYIATIKKGEWNVRLADGDILISPTSRFTGHRERMAVCKPIST